MLKYGAASARWYLGTRVRRSGWGQTWGEATWEGEQYLFQPQTDWDHCRVCRIRPLAGTGPAGNLAAEGRREISKRVKTTSYTLGGGSAVGPGARTFEEKTGKSKQWYRSCWRCVGKLRPAPGRLASLPGSEGRHVSIGGHSLPCLAGLQTVSGVAKRKDIGT